MARDNLRSRWNDMNTRCLNQNSHKYKNYGGRGIKIEWESFEEFKRDMIAGYKKELSLDRIDVNGNYSKENCRWATIKEQENNRTDNRILEFRGVKKNLTQWIEYFNLKSSTVRQRFYVYKWPLDRCLNQGN